MSGLEQAVIKNVEAGNEISTIVRSSFGPQGMNKMVINHLEKLFVTSDAATILREMDVEHPAAKLVVMAAQQQEQEIGDGSNLVVMFAGELMGQARDLIVQGQHPSDILMGYAMASKQMSQIIGDLTVYEEKDILDQANMAHNIRSVLAAKNYGLEDVLAPLVAEACLAAMPKNPGNFIVDSVRVCKILGGTVNSTCVVKGLVIPKEADGSVKHVEKCKVAVFQNSVDAESTETKGTVLLQSAQELLSYNAGEEKAVEKVIREMSEMGIGCVVSGGTFGDMAKHFLDKYQMLYVKVASKFELRRICKLVNARPLVKFEKPTFEDVGYCASMRVEEYGGQKVTVVRQADDNVRLATIIVRGSTQNILNDLENAIDDGINVVRGMTRDARFLAGAGASEIELARRLYKFGESCAGLEQYSIKAFAQALEVVPRTLAENAGLPATDIVAKLYAAHEQNDSHAGLDIESGEIRDMRKEPQVKDLLITKESALRLATNAAITVLRVDQIIMAKPAGGPKPQEKRGWDED